jgi:hypothetical protein
MITDEEFDVRMHDLFRQLGDRVPTVGDPQTILNDRHVPVPISSSIGSGSTGVRRGKWIGVLAAASIVVLGVAAVVTHDGTVRRIGPAVSTFEVDKSNSAVSTVEATLPPATAQQAEPTTTEQATTTTLSAPEDAYLQVATILEQAQGVSYRAMVKAVTECMLDQGYTYQSVPDPWEGFTDELITQPWNTPTLERASTRGYLQPRQGDPVVNPDGDTGFGTEAYQHALYGDVIDNWEVPPGDTVPDGFAIGGPVMDGCRPSAQTQIVGDGDPRSASRIGDYYAQMQNVEVRASIEITAAPEYDRMVALWAACMGDHGYHYTDLDQPRRTAWAGQRPEAEEIATATQDASCKSEVGLTQYGDQLFAGMVSDWFAQHPGRFAEITQYMQGITDRASVVLAS